MARDRRSLRRPSRSRASSGASDLTRALELGASVALSGDVALLGDRAVSGEMGAAEVFVRSDGKWVHEQRLLASDGRAGDAFGSSIALQGDTAIIGAVDDGTAAGNDAGSAYVFTRSDGVWRQQEYQGRTQPATFPDRRSCPCEGSSTGRCWAHASDLPARVGCHTKRRRSTRRCAWPSTALFDRGPFVSKPSPSPCGHRSSSSQLLKTREADS